MNYSMGSGIITYIRASKTFSKFRAFRSSVRLEVPCVSKFRAFRSFVCFEVPCASKFRAVTIYMMHMSEFVFCQTQISVSHISAYENDFHPKL